MRLIRFCAWIGLVVCTFLAQFSFGQCPDRAEWMQKIIAVEKSESAPGDKIATFNAYRRDYKKCQSSSDSIYARITHRLGDLYRVTGDIEQGIALTREAVAINKSKSKLVQRAFLANSYYNLGLYFNLLNLSTESQQYFDSCIEIGSLYPQKAYIARMAFEHKAFIYFTSGDYANSVFTAERGIDALRERDPIGKALLLMQRAQSLLELGRLDDSERDIAASFVLLNVNGGDDYLANAYSVKANFLARKKMYNESIQLYEKAFKLNEGAKNWEQCARDLMDLGFLYDNELKQSASALLCYNKAIPLTEITSDVYTRASIYANMGLVFKREKKFRVALTYFQRGLTTLPIQFHDTTALRNPGVDHLKGLANDYVGMVILADKAETLLDLYKVSKRKKILEQSLQSFLLVDFLIDQMRWKQTNGRSHLFWREKTRQWYEKALEVCYALKDHEHAFYFLEKSRAVLLNDKISELNAASRLSEKDYETEQQLRIRVITTQQRLATLSENDDRAKASQDVFESQRRLDQFVSGLQKIYPLYYRYRYDRSVPPLFEFRSKFLGKAKSLISFFNNDSVLYTLVVRPDSVMFNRVFVPSMKTDASRFLELLSSPGLINARFDEYEKLSTRISANIFLPLNIHTESVVVLHDEYFIPMEALTRKVGGATHFLVEDFIFNYAYSASFLSKVKPDDDDLTYTLAIAPVNFESSLKQVNLTGSDESMEELSPYLPGSTFLLNEKATKAGFLSQLADFDVVHLYSHAEANHDGEPVLYLYDSIVKVSDLQALGILDTKMITLFACHTGTGKNVTGEGTFSLARGFAAAGIPSTITSMWSLDNKAAYTLAELFYKNVYTGESTAKALQHAKIELLRSPDGKFSLPYFWAGTVLVGPSQKFSHGSPLEALTFYWFTLLFICIAVVIIIIMFVLKRKRSRLKSEGQS